MSNSDNPGLTYQQAIEAAGIKFMKKALRYILIAFASGIAIGVMLTLIII